MPALIDTHAHLQIEAFDVDRADVLKRATEAGVAAIINVGIDLAASKAAVELAEKEPICWAAVGLHPHEAESWSNDVAAALRELATHPKVVAIGETGLDFYRNHASREAQFRAFHGHIELCRETNLPMVIHNREATEAVLNTLAERADGVPTLLHCFGGSIADAERAASLGCLFGLGGPVTYPKASALRETVAALPSNRFVVETDCPWLAPQFRRGKRNEPAYVKATAEAAAEARGESFNAIAGLTTQNATAFFSFPL